MSQHDMVVANDTFPNTRADINSALAALVTRSSGATEPAAPFAHMVWVDTTSGTVKRRNAANNGWIVVDTIDETFFLTRATNTILDVSDKGKTIKATATFTQTLDAAATLGVNWSVGYIVDSGATITVDPNGAETIDGAATKVVIGPSSGFIYSNGTALFTVGFVAASTPSIPYGYLGGLTLSNNSTDPTNDIDIAAGAARDSTNAVDITLAAALTKRLDATFVVGTNQGGLDTGAVANNTYHVWLIRRSDTGVVDAIFSLSATAPTMPANYDSKRLIGSIVRSGAAIKLFVQDGDFFQLTTLGADISATDPGASAVTRTMASMPTGRRLRGVFLVTLAGTSTADKFGLLSDLSVTAQAPSNGTSNFASPRSNLGTDAAGAQVEVMTNTSAQIRSHISASEAATVLTIRTRGWYDTRGRDS